MIVAPTVGGSPSQADDNIVSTARNKQRATFLPILLIPRRAKSPAPPSYGDVGREYNGGGVLIHLHEYKTNATLYLSVPTPVRCRMTGDERSQPQSLTARRPGGLGRAQTPEGKKGKKKKKKIKLL